MKAHSLTPKRAIRLLLHIEMPLTLLSSLVLFFSYLSAREENLALAATRYPEFVVYLFLSIAITAFSVLLLQRLSIPDRP